MRSFVRLVDRRDHLVYDPDLFGLALDQSKGPLEQRGLKLSPFLYVTLNRLRPGVLGATLPVTVPGYPSTEPGYPSTEPGYPSTVDSREIERIEVALRRTVSATVLGRGSSVSRIHQSHEGSGYMRLEEYCLQGLERTEVALRGVAAAIVLGRGSGVGSRWAVSHDWLGYPGLVLGYPGSVLGYPRECLTEFT
eukprot:1190053-Prorocentrum_minimum.AAC.2